jgi:UTP--glucose-1-phosphate uridylyltransferase
MHIRKALITAAGPGQGALPLQRLVDRDGAEKTALEMIIEEIDAAGIESIGIVISPGNEEAYRRAAGPYVDRLSFVIQETPSGYGQALLSAKDFIGDSAFLHLVGDHLYLSNSGKRCAQQLIEVASQEECSVSAVYPTKEKMLPYFGAIGGQRLPQTDRLYGIHVLTPMVLEILEEIVAKSNRPVPLAEALQELASRERYLGCEIEGQRYNIGIKYGLLNTQLALSLSGVDRDQVLSDMIELLAVR